MPSAALREGPGQCRPVASFLKRRTLVALVPLPHLLGSEQVVELLQSGHVRGGKSALSGRVGGGSLTLALPCS